MRHVAPLVLAFIAAPALAGAQQPQPVIPVAPQPPSVIAMGQSEIKVTPDRATVMISVETRGRTAAAAGTENARITRVTLEALRAQRLPNDQLTTADYSVYPEQVWDEGTRRPRITGYVARNTIRAEVRDLAKVGDVIDAALAGGATMIQGVNFWSSNLIAARRQGLERAIANACADAAAIARGAGRVIGGPLELSSHDYMAPPPMPMAMMSRDMKAEAASPPTPINPGEQTLTVTVQTRWALASGTNPTGDVPACAR
jgi:uncharacterized protein YggE